MVTSAAGVADADRHESGQKLRQIRPEVLHAAGEHVAPLSGLFLHDAWVASSQGAQGTHAQRVDGLAHCVGLRAGTRPGSGRMEQYHREYCQQQRPQFTKVSVGRDGSRGHCADKHAARDDEHSIERLKAAGTQNEAAHWRHEAHKPRIEGSSHGWARLKRRRRCARGTASRSSLGR